jgi:hypothetical protein
MDFCISVAFLSIYSFPESFLYNLVDFIPKVVFYPFPDVHFAWMGIFKILLSDQFQESKNH